MPNLVSTETATEDGSWLAEMYQRLFSHWRDDCTEVCSLLTLVISWDSRLLGTHRVQYLETVLE